MQDIFLTETANYADVILPASAFYEKSGTVTNTSGKTVQNVELTFNLLAQKGGKEVTVKSGKTIVKGPIIAKGSDKFKITIPKPPKFDSYQYEINFNQ